MGAEFAVETLKPAELGAEARGLWAAFRDADPALRSPYFDLRYVMAAGDAAPGAEIAVISRQGRIEGFLPFQRRGKLIQPIAAPLTDYHGLLAAPGARIDLKALTAALGARRFRFSALVGGHLSLAHISVRPAMVADLSEGLEAYLGRRGGDFLKDKRRRARRLAEAHGDLSFDLAPATEADLDFVFRLKGDQFRRTGQHDVFRSPWTTRFLRRLASETAPDFGLRFATLRAGGRIVGAEVGLLSGSTYHLWFPVYEPEFARYSPGSLATLETIRVAAEMGLDLVDFGPAGEGYKGDFADPGVQVFEGDVTVGGMVETARNAADLALASAPAVRRALSAVGRKLDRRWDRITACEPRLEGRVTAASASLGDLARRRPKTSIGLGVGLSLGAGLVSLISD